MPKMKLLVLLSIVVSFFDSAGLFDEAEGFFYCFKITKKTLT
jgi:hypothetical protein